jgi:serine phosphatase RsbU (regulator of sigma subunit)
MLTAVTLAARARHELLSIVASIAIGVLFAGFYAVGQPGQSVSILLAGAVTGLTIWISIALLRLLFHPLVERHGARGRLGGQVVLFIVGGAIGWMAGNALSRTLFHAGVPVEELLQSESLTLMLIVTAIAVLVGAGFYAVNRLRDRLADTVQKLKDREWAEKELELARAIQTRLLPPGLVETSGFVMAARNLPARVVAGDFYDVVPLDDGSVVVVVADVAGKGLGASLIMASVKAVLPFVARESAVRAMTMLNEKLVADLGRREFVALAYARLRASDGSTELELLNAGFPDPYVVGPHGVRALSAPGIRLPLGVKRDVQYEPLTARLETGERLVFVSDGIPEAPSAGEPLGYERLAAILAAMDPTLHAEPWLDDFLSHVRAEVDEGLDDDWTAVAVERSA